MYTKKTFATSHPDVQKFKPTALKLAKQYVKLSSSSDTSIDMLSAEFDTEALIGVSHYMTNLGTALYIIDIF